jgi:glycosyltransferase involved in cell wall biosynthesis
MRVLFVRHGLFPGYLAPETKEWAKHLWRRGVHAEVAVLGERTPESEADPLEFPVHCIDPSNTLLAYRALRPLVDRADIVHYVLGKRLEFMPLLSRRPKFVFNHISVSVTGRALEDWAINMGKRLQPFLADHVVFTDEALAAALKPIRRIPTSLLPVGYPDDLFFPCPPPVPDGGKRLLYHGAVRPLRRLDELVKVLARLPVEFTLTIVGGGSAADESYRRSLGGLAASLGCADRLHLLKKPQAEIRPLIERAYLCLGYVPMLECYQDQFVIKTIEALACHRPVLATATRFTSSFREAMGHDRLLLTDGTVDDMVAKILGADEFVRRFHAPDNLATLAEHLAPYSFRHIVGTSLVPLYERMLGNA